MVLQLIMDKEPRDLNNIEEDKKPEMDLSMLSQQQVSYSATNYSRDVETEVSPITSNQLNLINNKHSRTTFPNFHHVLN